jgi:hypothetical protein
MYIKRNKKAKNVEKKFFESSFTFGTFKRFFAIFFLNFYIPSLIPSYRGHTTLKIKNDELVIKMSLSDEHLGLKILAKIKIYILSRAKLLFTV